MARLRVKHGVRNAYERYAWGVQPSASVEGEQLGLFATDPA
jgi:hypothetical protein